MNSEEKDEIKPENEEEKTVEMEEENEVAVEEEIKGDENDKTESEENHKEEQEEEENNEEEQGHVEEEEVVENLSEMTLADVLKINQNSIDFGNVFPGQIIEETIIILNNLSHTKVHFKIKVNCLTKEFDELDEYVYSMRRPTQNDVFNYNDTFLILLAHKAISYYKLAVKVPNWREEKEICGNIEIMSEHTKGGPIIIPVKSKITIPTLKCEKMIKLRNFDSPIVKLFLKNIKRQDFRIALKNTSNYTYMGELSLLKNENQWKCLDINFYPSQVNMTPNGLNNFMMSVKTMTKDDSEIINQEVRLVLLVKIRNSSIIYSYPIVLTIGDGTM
jgi:hypothetical protein